MQSNLSSAICGIGVVAGFVCFDKLKPLLYDNGQPAVQTMVNGLSQLRFRIDDNRSVLPGNGNLCKSVVLCVSSAAPLLIAMATLYKLGLLKSPDSQKEFFIHMGGWMGAAILEYKQLILHRTFAADLSDNDVPVRWQEDDFLHHFLCTINQTPIRHVIKDPIANGLYDKEVLLKWLQMYPSSPLTRERMSWVNTVSNRIETLQAIIDYRLYHLQARENQLNRQLGKEDKAWITETSQELEKEMSAFCTTPIDQIKQLPQFLAFHPNIYTCCITGHPIRHVMRPRWPETIDWNDETMPLLDILYEKEALEKYASEHSNQPPPKWPVEYLPWKLDNTTSDKERQRDLEKKTLVKIVEDLRQYCPFIGIKQS